MRSAAASSRGGDFDRWAALEGESSAPAAGRPRGGKEVVLSEQDLADHAWVDEWVLEDASRKTYTPEQWKQHFCGLSKKLSYMLRHGAARHQLSMGSDGYVLISDILRMKDFDGFSRDDVDVCVQKNRKQRFRSEDGPDGRARIRAQQGHTGQVAVDQKELTTPVTSRNIPPVAIHGTFWDNIESIKKQGIKTMGRDHIHMATGLPADGGVISGCRAGTDTFLYVDVKKAMVGGVEFMMSGNGVILTCGLNGAIPWRFILGATDDKGNPVDGFANRDEVPGQKRGVPGMGPSPSSGAASSQPPSRPMSTLSQHEKNFLKACKVVRDIWKIEAQKEKGAKIESNQLQKLDKKDDALKEVRDLLEFLAPDSDLREKNKDVLQAAAA